MTLSEIIRADPELQQVHKEIQSLQAKMMGTINSNRLSELKAKRDELMASERYQRFQQVQEDYKSKRARSSAG